MIQPLVWVLYLLGLLCAIGLIGAILNFWSRAVGEGFFTAKREQMRKTYKELEKEGPTNAEDQV